MVRFGTSRVILGVIGCSLIAGLASAQKLKVGAHRDEKADFVAIRTYTWLPTPPLKRDTAPDAVTDPRRSLDVIGPHISGAIDRELARKR